MKRKVGRPKDENITALINRFTMSRRLAAKKIAHHGIQIDKCKDDDSRRLLLGIKIKL